MTRNFKRKDPFAEGAAHGRGGQGEEIRFAFGKSSLGLVLVAASDKGLVSVSIGATQSELLETLQEEFPEAHLVRERGTLDDFLPRVIEFIENPAGIFELPLDLRGTDFQKCVWRAVQKIPMGQTSSYSEIAATIGSPKAIRAVASSCTKSKFSIIIPCHRILHKDGTPTGGGGEENWQRVLIGREAGAEGRTNSGGAGKQKRRAANQ